MVNGRLSMSFHTRAPLIPHDARVADARSIKTSRCQMQPHSLADVSHESLDVPHVGHIARPQRNAIGTTAPVAAWGSTPTRMWGAAATQEANPPSPPAGRTG